MSDHQTVPAAPASAAPVRRRGMAAAAALLLSLLALAGVLGGGWMLWHLQRERASGSQALTAVKAHLADLDQRVSQLDDQRKALRQRLSDAEDVNRSLREQLLSLGQRTGNLEDAVANLSRRTLSGHDAALLDQVDMLLTLGRARFTLFGDAAGAAAAYAEADHALAAVDDPAFAGVRQTLEQERRALAALHPQQRQARLDALAAWRGKVATLPLKPLAAPPAAPAHGFWARLGRALSGLVRIHHDADAPLQVADGRLARQLLQLELAQAQAALLAGDDSGWQLALQRAAQALQHDFDGSAAAVTAMRDKLAVWQQQRVPPMPQLGAALAELRNLRQVRQAQAAPAAGPASAASTAGAGKGGRR